VAELLVARGYPDTTVKTERFGGAPGTVVRCRNCSSPLIVISSIRGLNCVDLSGLADLGR